jgi:hypothetical protein
LLTETTEVTQEEDENEFHERQAVEKTRFQSPVPLLRQLRNLIFGIKIPDIYTRVSFYINTVLMTTFLVWDILSYFALNSTEIIGEQKGITVEAIVSARGKALGFAEGEFFARLSTFHSIGIICWIVFFFGLILMYRKIRRYYLFCMGALVFYLGMAMAYLSFTYYLEDTTAYDKIATLIMAVSITVHSYLMGTSYSGYRAGFFGEPIEEGE